MSASTEGPQGGGGLSGPTEPSAGPNGNLLGHTVFGAGRPGEPPVLLLNGGMMSYGAWAPISERLAERYRVVGCDFRGQLLSPGEAHVRLDDHAADLVRLLDHLGVERVHVLATSFGAAVALPFAAGRPERVASLALVTAADRVSVAMREATIEMRDMVGGVLVGGDRARFHDYLIQEVYSEAYRREHAAELAERGAQIDLLPASWFEGLDGLLAALTGANLEPALAQVARRTTPAAEGFPALVVLAVHDRVISAKRSRALAAALGADLVEHPTSGHALVAEEPDWVTEVYLDFLERRG